MGLAIGQSLPFAVGVLVSPLPIVAVALMLVSARARVNGPAFVVGWVVSIGVVVLGAALLTGGVASGDDGPAAWSSWLKLGLGLVFLLLATRQWLIRPRGAEEPPVPVWIKAVDRFTAVRSAGLAVLLSVVNPKNLALVVAGGAAIGASESSVTDEIVAAVVFTLIAGAAVIAPVAVHLAMGDRATALLDRAKSWLVRRNSVIIAALLLVIGAKLIWDAVTVL